MKANKSHLKLVKTEPEIFNAPVSYEFIMVGRIKIETVESFVNRGGKIVCTGTFSDPLHPTNCPADDVAKSYDAGPVVAVKKAA